MTENEEKILHLIDEKATVDFLQKLIQTPSVNPPGEELAIAELVAEKMKEIGLETKLVSIDKKRVNVVGRIRGTGRQPSLLFSGHLDTVPPGKEAWQYDPFSGKIVDNKMYGRGTTDMKCALASMLMAADALLKAETRLEGDLIIGATADEEAGQLGSMNMVEDEWLDGVGAIMIGEPTSLDVFIAEKGAFWLEITTHGKTAHSSTPHLGINAVMHMSEFLQETKKIELPHRKHPLLGEPTINVGTIEGGVKINVVPDQCKVTVDIRTVPGQRHDAILQQFKDVINKIETEGGRIKADIEIINDRPPVETSPDESIVKTVLEAAQEITQRKIELQGARYYTDGAVFVPKLKIPMVICGAGDAKLAHQPNEYVEIPKLVDATKIYTISASRFLS